MIFSPDGKSIACGSEDGSVILWDVRSRKIAQSFVGHCFAVNAAAYSPDGTTLACAGADGTIKLWDLVGSRQMRNLAGPQRHRVFDCL